MLFFDVVNAQIHGETGADSRGSREDESEQKQLIASATGRPKGGEGDCSLVLPVARPLPFFHFPLSPNPLIVILYVP